MPKQDDTDDYLRMLEALEFMQIAAKRALELGCGLDRLREHLDDVIGEHLNTPPAEEDDQD